jgi:hypothetical protein
MKYETRWNEPELFVDINFPRADRINEQTFPSFYRLLRAVNDDQIGLVYIDIKSEIGTSQYYGWVADWLKKSGARVINAFYDKDGALEETLSRIYKGQADANEIDDASDFVAFYPALSSEICRAALRGVLHVPGCQKAATALSSNDLWGQLGRLGDRSPYAAGRFPFIQEDLEWEWSARRHDAVESERTERRKHEMLFKLAPAGVGSLIDEYPSNERDARNDEERLWAERRIESELRFEKTVNGNTVSYTREINEYLVFADIRVRGRITFFAYKLPRDAKEKGVSRCSFNLQDRFSRDLEGKWKSAFTAAI